MCLLADNRPWVKRLARWAVYRYGNAAVHVDDLEQAGMIALHRCAADYDPTIGASLRTFARTSVLGAMIDEIRAGSPTWREHRAGRPVPEFAPLEAAETVPTPEPSPAERAEMLSDCALLRRLVRQLPGRQRQVIADLFDREDTLRAVGERLAVSDSMVLTIKQQALARLRTRFNAQQRTPAP